MNAPQTIPNCFEVKDTVSESPGYISSRVAHQRAGLFSSVFGDENAENLNHDLLYVVVEAAVSPAKYALFLYTGATVLDATNTFSSSVMPSSTIKIGALGGTVLALLYFILLVRSQKSTISGPSQRESIIKCASSLCKEVFYTILAALVGLWGCGLCHSDKLLFFATAGAIGPLAFAAVAAVLLCALVGVVWSVEKFRDWYAGY